MVKNSREHFSTTTSLLSKVRRINLWNWLRPSRTVHKNPNFYIEKVLRALTIEFPIKQAGKRPKKKITGKQTIL